MEWKLWNAAGAIVGEAIDSGASRIVLEQLRGIRARIRVAKKQRLVQYGWPFASLEAKIRHVASKQGIRVETINAAYTSQQCSRCGHVARANRPSQTQFRCVVCGYSHPNADFVASHNIRHRYACGGCAACKPALALLEELNTRTASRAG